MVVLLIAGNHVPVIGVALALEEGKVKDPPLQIGATCVKVGVTCGLTVTDTVSVPKQPFDDNAVST